ncbi:MAG: T9SS type A sorting domain-containing protein [Bacteroidia bacterium]
MKKLAICFGLLASVIGGKLTAQTGTLTGWGMSICNQYSFTVCPGTVITPLNYNSQNFVCTSRRHEDISFVNMGSSWRVEINTWDFVPTLTGATVTGTDISNSPVSLSLGAGDVLEPASYTVVGPTTYVMFDINNVSTGIWFDRNNFQIALTAPSPASFSLSITNTGVSGTSAAAGTHVWDVYSAPNGIGGPYTLLGTYNTASFSHVGTATCYYVVHTVTTAQCGSSCQAQTICRAECPSGNPDGKIASPATNNANIEVFPNPASAMVSIDIPSAKDEVLNISVYDFSGKIVLTKQATGNENKTLFQLNTESLSPGTYLVKVTGADNREMHKTLIIN